MSEEEEEDLEEEDEEEDEEEAAAAAAAAAAVAEGVGLKEQELRGVWEEEKNSGNKKKRDSAVFKSKGPWRSPGFVAHCTQVRTGGDYAQMPIHESSAAC